MKYILAHDLGTSGNKATLFSEEGQMITSEVFSYGCHYFNGNWAEQDPEDWWQAICVTSKNLIDKAGIDPGEIAAISSAAYAFYKLTLAMINLFKAKNWKDPLVQSLRNVSLTDALVSLFALQTTLVALYSSGEQNMMALNIAVGIAVMVTGIVSGVLLIVGGAKLLAGKNRILF